MIFFPAIRTRTEGILYYNTAAMQTEHEKSKFSSDTSFSYGYILRSELLIMNSLQGTTRPWHLKTGTSSYGLGGLVLWFRHSINVHPSETICSDPSW